jgi:hypothetical protein
VLGAATKCMGIAGLLASGTHHCGANGDRPSARATSRSSRATRPLGCDAAAGASRQLRSAASRFPRRPGSLSALGVLSVGAGSRIRHPREEFASRGTSQAAVLRSQSKTCTRAVIPALAPASLRSGHSDPCLNTARSLSPHAGMFTLRRNAPSEPSLDRTADSISPVFHIGWVWWFRRCR